ncbi:MAG TPA: hypothetical protein PKD26_08485 [Pyrinomonadaceae bacterium]|nr:hypothetical protein [Pyrinomonadaceae bacterium]
MIDAKHIAALEAWLNKTRDEQKELMMRLRDAEDEVENLRAQITALDEIAQQAESMIDNALVLMRDGIRGSASSRRPKFSLDEGVPVSDGTDRKKLSDPPTVEVGAIQPITAANVSYIGNGRPVLLKNSQIEPVSNRFADRTITQACTLLLREAGFPLHVNDLYKLLVAGGMEFKGNNPTISIAVSLNRNRRFRKVGPGTFDLIMREASRAAS